VVSQRGRLNARDPRAQRRLTRAITASLVIALAVGAALTLGTVGRGQAPSGDNTLSVDATGRVLHRFLTALGGGPASHGDGPNGQAPTQLPGAGAATPPTPSFIYDPRRGPDTAAKPSPRPDSKRPDRAMPPLTDLNPVPRPRPTEAEIGVLPVAPDPDAEPPAPSEATPAEGAPPAVPGEALTSDPQPSPSLAGEPSPMPGEADLGAGDAAPEEVSSATPDSIRPDTATEKDAQLEYFETFNPSIVPHKRGRALNSVDDNFDLKLIRGHLRPVKEARMEDVASVQRDIFTAEAVVEARGDEAIPMPSVSSDDRLLSWEASPPQALVFLRDDGDNLYVRLGKPGRATVRWRIAAPRTYFARSPEAARRMSLGAIPAAVRPRPTPVVRRQAREVARALGIGLSGSLGRTLDALVLYFRSFAPGDPPPERAGIYKDLALGRVGVCRHRAFAFVATAIGLGVPARYVYNEAHVFVEVWLPADASGPAGWTRVDLGGGADSLEIYGGRDKTMHRPPEDAFPIPRDFDRDAIAGATEVHGLPQPAIPAIPAREDPKEASAPTEIEDAAPPTGSRPPSDEREFWSDMEASLEKNQGGAEAPVATPEPDTRAAAPWLWPASALWPASSMEQDAATARALFGESAWLPVDARVPTEVTMRVDAADVTRGLPFGVAGSVAPTEARPRDGAPPEGFVQVLILSSAASGAAANTPWLLGAARLDERGHFNTTVTVPSALPPGGYELVVEYPGSTRFRPSMGR